MSSSSQATSASGLKHVLIVDDSEAIREQVSRYLSKNGFVVSQAEDGVKGLDLALSSRPDVIVLDIVMPRMDGIKLAHQLRRNRITSPIILLTGKTGIESKEAGFSSGADDYLSKPFDVRELELRIKALLRRSSAPVGSVSNPVKIGELMIDLDSHSATLSGKPINLTPIEFKILSTLTANPGRVYSRQELLSTIWDTEYDGYRRNVDPHVTRLRTKLEADPKKPRYILTVWGLGYKINESLTDRPKHGE
jgi:DNA-binding response OmpR family regulator